MPANRCPAFASLAIGSLLLASGCVNLSAPNVLVGGSGGQGGTTSETTAPATGGVGGTAAGGAGGETTVGTGGEAAGGAGGETTVGAGGTVGDDEGGEMTGGTGGSIAGDTGGVPTGGGDDGGVSTGGVGGKMAGGTKAGGTTASGGSKSPGDAAVPTDLRPGKEAAAPVETGSPPDAATATTDAPATPDVPPDMQGSPDTTPDGPAGLVLYYSCETVSNGTTLPDLSGRGNDGTLVGPFSIAPGKVGNALSLTATNNLDAGASGGYVKMPPAILATASEMTIATWFKINSTLAFQRIFDIGTSDTTSSMYLTPRDNTLPNNNLRFSIRTGDGTTLRKEDLPATPVKTIPTNTWEHVAVVLDSSGGARLYLNGAQVGSTTLTLRLSSLGSTPNDWIGRSEFAANPYLDGAIDEFRIYNRALSSAEILALYSQ